MTQRRYLQLDVFADRPGAGNPLGVVVDAHGLDTAAMQALAAWLNLSETVFFMPAGGYGADYHVRIFTPSSELPFAGHPSVGAAWAALELGLAQAPAGTLVQQCAAGLLPVRIDGRGHARTVHVRAPRAVPLATRREHIDLLDLLARDWPRASRAPALWNNGPGWWLLELANEASVRAVRPDLPAIAALSRASQAAGPAIFARSQDPAHDLVVRAFCPADAPNVPEDPVTGSANACIAALLHADAALPGHAGRYTVSQGREVGRDGLVQVHVDAEGEVWIGGQVQRVLSGHLHW